MHTMEVRGTYYIPPPPSSFPSALVPRARTASNEKWLQMPARQGVTNDSMSSMKAR